MTKTELVKKLEGVENIDALVSEINLADSDEAVIEVLERHGVELDSKELEGMLSSTDELDEELLEAVSGGCKCGWIRKLVVWGLNQLSKALGGKGDISCH